MKLITAFFKLIRWPNLFFIILTQFVFYFAIVESVYFPEASLSFDITQLNLKFYLLVFSSVAIAAAGYIINDYFDLQIDGINKPDKIVVDVVIKRRAAIIWHFALSFLGIVGSFIVSYKSNNWVIVMANVFCVILLWFYSTHFKKKLLIGNIVISVLTAWVILVIYFYVGANLFLIKGWNLSSHPFNEKLLYKLTILYAGFAFNISLIREIVKDMEDMQGDANYNCKTMPIVLGLPVAKMFVAVWIFFCVAVLLIIDVYAWQSGLRVSALYSVGSIVLPLVIILKKLNTAIDKKAFHQISNALKWVMLMGILSMLFFKFHI